MTIRKILERIYMMELVLILFGQNYQSINERDPEYGCCWDLITEIISGFTGL